jgi:hypothetical protein
MTHAFQTVFKNYLPACPARSSGGTSMIVRGIFPAKEQHPPPVPQDGPDESHEQLPPDCTSLNRPLRIQ